MHTTRTQFIIDALQGAIAHYDAALTITSKIGMDLYLAKKRMGWGLCHYFAKQHGGIDEIIMREMGNDLTFPVENNGPYIFPLPGDFLGINDLKTKALAPRLEWMQKTLARLQQQLQTT